MNNNERRLLAAFSSVENFVEVLKEEQSLSRQANIDVINYALNRYLGGITQMAEVRYYLPPGYSIDYEFSVPYEQLWLVQYYQYGNEYPDIVYYSFTLDGEYTVDNILAGANHWDRIDSPIPILLKKGIHVWNVSNSNYYQLIDYIFSYTAYRKSLINEFMEKIGLPKFE